MEADGLLDEDFNDGLSRIHKGVDVKVVVPQKKKRVAPDDPAPQLLAKKYRSAQADVEEKVNKKYSLNTMHEFEMANFSSSRMSRDHLVAFTDVAKILL